MSEYNKNEFEQKFWANAGGGKVGKVKLPAPTRIPKKSKTKKLVQFDVKTNDGPYGAPVCGYLAKIAIPKADCKRYKFPFKEGDTVLVFGDIAKMPGHCVFAGKDGKVHFGYHTADFTPLAEEEI